MYIHLFDTIIYFIDVRVLILLFNVTIFLLTSMLKALTSATALLSRRAYDICVLEEFMEMLKGKPILH